MKDVVELLMGRGIQHEAINEAVINCYNQVMKLVEIEKQEYMKLIKEPGVNVKGEETRLYRLLKEGPARDVKPVMIHQVIGGSEGESNLKIEKAKGGLFNLGRGCCKQWGRACRR